MINYVEVQTASETAAVHYDGESSKKWRDGTLGGNMAKRLRIASCGALLLEQTSDRRVFVALQLSKSCYVETFPV